MTENAIDYVGTDRLEYGAGTVTEALGTQTEDEAAADNGTPIPEYVRMNLEHAELSARAAQLATDLAERKVAAMQELVASIVGWIDNYGLGRVEVMAELRKIIAEPKAKPKGKVKGKPAPMKITLFSDPACPGRVYKRGPTPAWMRERMATLGLDPGNPAHRKTYKDNHLQVVG